MSAKLTVLTGKQQGAEAWLIPGAVLTVGSSLDDDVVLRDPSVVRQHAALMLKDNHVTLSCESGPCLADGTSIEPGDRCVLGNETVFKLGDISLNIKSDATVREESITDQAHDASESASITDTDPAIPRLQATMNAQAAFSTASMTDLPAVTDDSQSAVTDSQSANQGSKWLFRTLTIAAFLICGAIVWQSGLFKQSAVEQDIDLQAAISSLSLAGVHIEHYGNNVVVSGYVDSIQESRQLGQWLDQTGFQVTNDVLVGEAIGDQVFDVFRVNGIPADVQVSNGADVVVATKEADTSQLNIVEERVKQDVPGIATLEINNVPPVVIEPVDFSTAELGKQVAIVVSDEPSYIVTVDQSRYFVGSLLPTGHRIEAIKDGIVTLVKNGVSTALEF